MKSPVNLIRKISSRVERFMLEKALSSGGWLQYGVTIPKDWPHDWWQRNYGLGTPDFRTFAPVVTCVNIISQDMSRIPLHHVRDLVDGSSEPVRNTAPMRVFRRPNSYQTKSDWIAYIMMSLLTDGNSYNYCVRNDRQTIVELYPIRPDLCQPYLSEEGEIFYRFGSDASTTLAQIETGIWVPARDVMHLRGATPVHPLIGESPLVAATVPTMTGTRINEQNAAFFSNMSRPSGILRHPKRLNEPALKAIKNRFKEITSDKNSGEVAVLSEGMDWTPLTMSAVDAEIAEIYKLSERQIFQIFRVPPFLAGDLDKANLTNVEELTRFYLLSGLAVWENRIEEWLTRTFRLPSDERIEFDVEKALLKGDLKTRMEAYAKGIQGGIYKIDEARKNEGLPPVPYGDEVRVQQQMVPLSYGAALQPPGQDSESEPPVNDERPPLNSDKIVQLQYERLKRQIG